MQTDTGDVQLRSFDSCLFDVYTIGDCNNGKHYLPYNDGIIITIIKTTSELMNVSVTVTVTVTEVGVVDTRYGVSQSGADAER